MHSCLPLLTRNRFLTNPTSWCWWIRSKLQLLKLSSSVSSIPKFLGFAEDELGLFFLNLFSETCWGKLHSCFAFRMHILVAYIVKTGNWEGLKASAKYVIYYSFKKWKLKHWEIQNFTVQNKTLHILLYGFWFCLQTI